MALPIDNQPDLLGLPPRESLPARRRAEREFREARDRLIAIRYAGGETLQALGDSFGITGERVRQIIEGFVAAGAIPRRERASAQAPARRRPAEPRSLLQS